MEYIASLSYGKDSIAMLEVIKQHGMPLDRIVHIEIMATDTIPADLPPMMEFKSRADAIIKERYGIEVEHIHNARSYQDYFYLARSEKAAPENRGKIYGFPMMRGAWCNSRLKMSCLGKLDKPDITQYIGIAADEPNRFHNLSERKRSPLVEHDVTEAQARTICEGLGLLSPIYTQSARGGCWFCNKQPISQLRLLRSQYPDYWSMMLKWDADSPITFKPPNKSGLSGKTVHDFEQRFANEEEQTSLFNAERKISMEKEKQGMFTPADIERLQHIRAVFGIGGVWRSENGKLWFSDGNYDFQLPQNTLKCITVDTDMVELNQVLPPMTDGKPSMREHLTAPTEPGTPKDEKERLYRLAVNKWGALAQIVMVMEEMSELQKELCKYTRGRDNYEAIAEEIADVEIMLEQMTLLFDCADLVAGQKRKKLARLADRLTVDETNSDEGERNHE